MSTLSLSHEHHIEMLNTWATICGSTLDQLEIPWNLEVEEQSDSVEFRIEFSEAPDPTTQSKWMSAINWATDTMRSFACQGTAKNGDPINKDGVFFDAYRGEFITLWVAIPLETVDSAFSQGVPLLDYIGFVPNDILVNAMEE